MPRIRDNIRDCAVYLYSSESAAESGIGAGGSGFLVGIRSKTDENWVYPYVVTNRHIIEEGSTVVRLNTKAGATDIVDLSARDWVFHPDGDDLAVAGIALHSDYHDYMLVNDNPMFLTREWMGDARLGLGDNVFMVGRLIDEEGRQQNSPTVRFGQIAMMPGEPVRVSPDRKQECFLVDVQSLAGLTGSPVFVTVHHLRLNNPIEFNHAWFPHLLGVNCGQIATPLLSGSDEDDVPSVQNGLMKVLPAWRLVEILNQPQFLRVRREEDTRRQGAVMGRPVAAY